MLTPNKIELLNYGLSEQAEVILTKMLNKRALDYSTLKELTAYFKDMSAESVQSAVEELHGRRFLYLIPKYEREVYAVNKLRIANMGFEYGPRSEEDDEESEIG